MIFLDHTREFHDSRIFVNSYIFDCMIIALIKDNDTFS